MIYDKLIQYFQYWNSKINLSAIRDEKWIKTKHIQDSLFPIKLWIFEKIELPKKVNVVDVWTWSGFPLLPLAVEKSNWNFTWLESKKKKVDAVNDIIYKLWLKNVEVIWTRAEDYKEKQFDILMARAVAYIDKLLKFTDHLVKKWWYFVLYKIDSDDEYNDILKNCKIYKLELLNKIRYKLFSNDINRIIYIIRKL